VPPFRILLVEDFEPFRRFVRLALQSRAEFEVVGEAVDGLDAVQRAKDLQPDLILLDIGLPKLNGMAAAEQIRIFAPDAKLLFVSMETSSAIVEEAFRLGAQGYITKVRAQADLIPGIDAVLAGKRFVSSDLEVSVGTKNDHRHDV
jgi:DNA-binding NarL/FixJ family response regulator